MGDMMRGSLTELVEKKNAQIAALEREKKYYEKEQSDWHSRYLAEAVKVQEKDAQIKRLEEISRKEWNNGYLDAEQEWKLKVAALREKVELNYQEAYSLLMKMNSSRNRERYIGEQRGKVMALKSVLEILKEMGE